MFSAGAFGLQAGGDYRVPENLIVCSQETRFHAAVWRALWDCRCLLFGRIPPRGSNASTGRTADQQAAIHKNLSVVRQPDKRSTV